MRWSYLNSELKPGDFTKDKIGYYYGTNSNSVRTPKDLPSKKIAAFDLDSTLIVTKSGRTFAKDADDWEWFDQNVPDMLNSYYEKGFRVMIISNQAGIKQSSVKLHTFQSKISRIESRILAEYPTLEFEVFCLNNKDVFRKPFPTVITTLFDSTSKGSFYCGDAAGRVGDHSASDIEFAHNIGVEFYTPEQLFKGENLDKGILPDNIVQYSGGAPLNTYEYTANSIGLPELILMVGYPGSGKSYIARQIQEHSLISHDTYESFISANKVDVLSLDDLKTRAKLEAKMKECISKKQSILIDNTNLSSADRSKLIGILDSEGVRQNYVVRAIVVERGMEESYHANCYRYYRNYKTDPKFIPEYVYKIMRAKFYDPNTNLEDIDIVDRVVPGYPTDYAYYYYFE